MKKLFFQIPIALTLAFSANAIDIVNRVTVGSRLANDNAGGLESLHPNDEIIMSTTAGKSYACTFLPNDSQVIDMKAEAKDGAGSMFTASYCGNVDPVVNTFEENEPNDNRLCFTAPESGETTLYVEGTGEDSFVKAAIECLETTQFGGYNTFSTSIVFLELENRTAKDTTVQLTISGSDGSILRDDITATVLANSRLDIDIHSIAGPNQYGTITVGNNAPYGGMSGRVSGYSQIDGALVLQGQTALESRKHSF